SPMQSSYATLVPNPHAELSLVREAGTIRAITVRAPLKGQRLTVTNIVRETEPEVFGTLLVSAIRREVLRPASETPAVTNRLAEIGFLLPEDQISSPVWFCCDIDDPPTNLVPRRVACPSLCSSVEDLVVNPTFRHLGRSGPPPEMRGRKVLPNR